jgi:hypothetical protein
MDVIPAARDQLSRLEALLPKDDDADLLALLLFRANLARLAGDQGGTEREGARAFQLAVKHGWSFFIQRSLYVLANLHQDLGQITAARCHLKLLKAVVDPEESVYMCYLVNQRFMEQDLALPTTFRFDADNFRVMISGQWLHLDNKPLIFAFLRCLHECTGFVEKECLAERLWPGEAYNPVVHDARIFDIARRTRALIECYEHQPVSLLSGRLGYRLAKNLENSHD